ncbi:hypothetical protein BGX24_007351 [Mortierella sp. AD032]|nr:hypothetical protein BGX24_007351 [Mortierella sp. AD032]
MYMVDLERILDSFPNLKALTIKGWMHEYFPATAAAEPEGLRNHDDNINSDTDEGTEPTTPYPLESFTFDQQFMGRTGPNAFTIFRRLSNLKKIWLQSLISEYICSQESRPWAFGRALKEYCPKIESIETQGPVAVWLFDLPILPPLSSSSSLSSEPPQYAPTTTLSETGVTPQLRQRLQEQEQEELLGGQNAAPFFPQLKKLVFRIDHTFSYQDLISLGVQAQFLTHLEFHQLSRRSLIFEMYERDAPFATASVPTSIADGKSMDYAYTEAKRLRKRHPFNLRDLMLFLQLCSSLRYFSLSGNGSNISIHDIFELTPDSEETTGRAQPFIRPWACEATLETLRIGLDLEDTRVLYQPKECHALVWKHLGRLCKLRSLSLFLSTLIPSFSYGVEGLLGGGCVGAMLQEIRHLPGWRQVEDRCEMVLWFAKSCPRLMVLGLVRMKGFVEEEKDEKGMKYTAFMEDEDVKQCSIHRIFVEEQELWGAYN